MQKQSSSYLAALACGVAALIVIVGFITGKHHLIELINGGAPAQAAAVPAQTQLTPTPPSSLTPESKMPPTPPTPPQQDLALLTAEVKSAIETADAIEIRALRTLDSAALETAYSGEALRQLKEFISQCQAENVHKVSTLESRVYNNIQIDPDGQSAKVSMTERWHGVTYDNASGQQVSEEEPKDVPQTAFLKKASNGWMITTIDFQS